MIGVPRSENITVGLPLYHVRYRSVSYLQHGHGQDSSRKHEARQPDISRAQLLVLGEYNVGSAGSSDKTYSKGILLAKWVLTTP